MSETNDRREPDEEQVADDDVPVEIVALRESDVQPKRSCPGCGRPQDHAQDCPYR